MPPVATIQSAPRSDNSIFAPPVGLHRKHPMRQAVARGKEALPMVASIEFGASPEGVQSLTLKRANRHGLIAGATGTGKTVTLQVLAEAFAREGVNVFAADIKGDLSGCAAADATAPEWAQARAAEINMPI